MRLGPLIRTLLLSDAAVAALVAGRVYPKILPQSPTVPAVTYQRISRVGVADTLDAPGSLARPRVQVDSWGSTGDQAEALGETVREAINGFRGNVSGGASVQRIALETVREEYDDEVKLHRHSADYYVWHEEDRDMPATLTSRVSLTVEATNLNALDQGSASFPALLKKVQDLTSGVGASQADRLFIDTRTLAASTTEDLDLNGGGLVDGLGAVLVFARLRALIIIASPLNTNNVVILGDANSVPILGTAATVCTLKPGAVFVFTDPSTAGAVVTAGTGDIIQIANGGAGTSVDYTIAIIGASA